MANYIFVIVATMLTISQNGDSLIREGKKRIVVIVNPPTSTTPSGVITSPTAAPPPGTALTTQASGTSTELLPPGPEIETDAPVTTTPSGVTTTTLGTIIPGTGDIDLVINAIVNAEAVVAVASNITNPGVNGTVQKLESGSTVIMNSGNVFQVMNANFGNPNFVGKEIAVWNFEANNCILSATCPCVNIASSWNCAENYLKIRNGLLYDFQKFCGGNKPGQPIVSDSGELTLRFRSSLRKLPSGFTCFVSCTGVGMTAPTLPGVSCPTF